MNDKIAADLVVLIPAVSLTWLDMFDGGLKVVVGIVTLIAVLIRLRIVMAEWKARK